MFTDMNEKHWAYKAVEALANDSIMEGYPDGTFHPDDAITRAEASAVLSRVLNKIQSEGK